MRLILLLCMLLPLTACGVKGPLYRPSDSKPDPKTKHERNVIHPFPDQLPEEQEIMPDLI